MNENVGINFDPKAVEETAFEKFVKEQFSGREIENLYEFRFVRILFENSMQGYQPRGWPDLKTRLTFRGASPRTLEAAKRIYEQWELSCGKTVEA